MPVPVLFTSLLLLMSAYAMTHHPGTQPVREAMHECIAYNHTTLTNHFPDLVIILSVGPAAASTAAADSIAVVRGRHLLVQDVSFGKAAADVR